MMITKGVGLGAIQYTSIVPKSSGPPSSGRQKLHRKGGRLSNIRGTVCPPYNAVVGYHDAEPRCN